MLDPDGRDPREGNTVVNINFSNCFITKINDRKAKFSIADKPLRRKALDNFAYNTSIGPNIPTDKFMPDHLNSKPIKSLNEFNKHAGTLKNLLGNKEGLARAWVEASQSFDGYEFVELTENGAIQRTVENKGKGFENFVTVKITFDETGNISGMDFFDLTTEKDKKTGEEKTYIKQNSFKYQDGKTYRTDKKYEAIPNLKEDDKDD